MPKLSTSPNRFYPSIPTISEDPVSHTTALQIMKEGIQTHERRDKNYLKSFIRFEELVDLGIIDSSGEYILDTAAGTLDGLSDVTIASPIDGEVLTYQSGEWVNSAAGGELNDLTVAVTWANVPAVNITEVSVTQHEAAIDHDALLNFLANEHIDWTVTGPDDVHVDRIDVLSVTQHEAAIDHDALLNFEAAEHIDWSVTGAEDIHADRFANSPAEVNDLSAVVTWTSFLRDTASGADVSGTVANNTKVRLYSPSFTTEYGFVGYEDSSVLQIKNKENGGNVELRGEEGAGSARTMLIATPGGAVTQYHNLSQMARTAIAASGGLEVNNTVTGAGFERVLTVSDIGGAEVNDLTVAVTWANVPDANITQTSVTQHEAALTILESQITDANILARLAANEAVTGDWEFNKGTNAASTVKIGEDTTHIGTLQEARLEMYGSSSSLIYGVGMSVTGAILTFDPSLTANTISNIDFGGLDLHMTAASDIRFFDATGVNRSVISTGSLTTTQFLAQGVTRFDFTGYTQLWLRDGAQLRVSDTTDAKHADFDHDGVDFNTAFTTAADWNITGLTGRILQGAETLAYVSEVVTDHTGLTSIGTNTHAQIDTHIGDSTIHFTEAAIDHTAILNIGTNTHAAIDTHIALVNEHIDWTNATQNLLTSGSIKSTDFLIAIENAAATATTFLARNSAGGVTLNVNTTTGHAQIGQTSGAGAAEDVWLHFTRNGQVDIRYNNATKLVTTNTGIDVTGNIVVSGLVDGKDVAGHVDDSTIHFTEAAIDHTAILNIGTNTHVAIDTHIALVEEHIDWTVTGAQDIHADRLSSGANMVDSTISRGVILDYGITEQAPTVSANAVTVNCTLGNVASIDMDPATADVVLTLSNPPASGTYGEVTLVITMGTPPHGMTWPGSITWQGGSAPNLSTVDNTVDLVHLMTVDGGTNWFGTFALNASAIGEVNDLTAAVVWANVPNANITVGSVTQHVASIDHDLLLNFVSQEHIRWDLTGAEDIHADRYTNTVYVHPNHSGDVSSVADGAQTVEPVAISGQALVTAVTGDMVLLWDATDSLLKRANVSDLLSVTEINDLSVAVTWATTNRVLTDINTATPPTTEAVTGFFEIRDNEDVDSLMTLGFEGNNDMFLRNKMRGGEFFMTARNSAGTLKTFFEYNPGSGLILRANGNFFTYVNNTEAAFAAIANGAASMYHNNVKTVNTTTLATGGLEVDNDYNGVASFERVLTESDIEAGLNVMVYDFSTGTGGGDPGAGGCSFNSGVPASIVTVYIDDASLNTRNREWLFGEIANGDLLTFHSETVEGDFITLKASGVAVDQTGYWTIPVTYVSGAIPANNSNLRITWQQLSESLTVEVNDLSVAVTWVNVPDANITETSVTQHEAALTILESQITDANILARIAGTETITGEWDFDARIDILGGNRLYFWDVAVTDAMYFTETGAQAQWVAHANPIYFYSSFTAEARATMWMNSTGTSLGTGYRFTLNDSAGADELWFDETGTEARIVTDANPLGFYTQSLIRMTLDSTGLDMTVPINMADNVLSRPEVTDYGITEQAPTVTANAVTVNCTLGNVASIDMDPATADVVLTLSNPPASGTYGEVTLLITMGTPAHGITWPVSITWQGGVAPNLTTTDNVVDLIHLMTVDGGTTWFGTYATAAAGSFSTTLAALTDTNLTGVATGDMLFKSAGDWLDTGGEIAFTPGAQLDIRDGVDLWVRDGTNADVLKLVETGAYGQVIDTVNPLRFYPKGVYVMELDSTLATFTKDILIETNADALWGKDTGAANRWLIGVSAGDRCYIGDTNLAGIQFGDQNVYGISGDLMFTDNSDDWLRLNNTSTFVNGVYTPGLMRADGGFMVDTAARFEVDADGFLTTNQLVTINNSLIVSHTAPRVFIRDTDATVDEGNWIVSGASDLLRIQLATDAAPTSAASTVLTIERAGTTPGAVSVTGSSFDIVPAAVTTEGFRFAASGDVTYMRPRNAAGTGWDSTADLYFDRSLDRWNFDSTLGINGGFLYLLSGTNFRVFNNASSLHGEIEHDETNLVIRTGTGAGDIHFIPNGGDVDITGNLTFDAVTDLIAGIQNQNLVDKIAAETISGSWTHTGNVNINDGTDQLAISSASGTVTFQPTGGMTLLDININTQINQITMQGDIFCADNTVDQPVIQDYAIESSVQNVSGTTATMTFSNGPAFQCDMEAATGNVTITLSGGPPAGTYGEIIIELTQDTTVRTLTWAGGTFKWPGGVEPAVTLTANAIDIFHFMTWDGGTTWYGSALQDMS